MSSRRKARFAALVAVAPLALAGTALASNQVKGGSYSGPLVPANGGVVVSFKVSPNGKQVTALKINNTPLYCSGGGPPIPIHFKNASISGKGTFTSSGEHVLTEGPKKGQVGTKLQITGKFLKGKIAQGTLTTTYVGIPSCGGKSKYTASA